MTPAARGMSGKLARALRRPSQASRRTNESDDKLIFEQITTHLGELEEKAGNLPEAIKLVSSRPN